MYSNDCCGSITYSTMSTDLDRTTVSKYIVRSPYKSDFYTPRKIIFNDPVSVVFWNDGTKTIVRRSEGEQFNKYTAFTAALAKKIFGNNTRVNAIVKSGIDQKEKDAAKKAKMAKKNS